MWAAYEKIFEKCLIIRVATAKETEFEFFRWILVDDLRLGH